MNYVLVFCPEVREELNDAHSWYESQKRNMAEIVLIKWISITNNVRF